MKLRSQVAPVSGSQIRALTARLARPEDPLAEWRLDYEEWQKALADFRELEQEKLIRGEAPPAFALRQHRYLLFLLMAHGEELALALLQSRIDPAEERKLVSQVDAFLGGLRDALNTWHGEALPEHRQALAGFLA